MLGIAFGTLCLLGLIGMAKGAHHRHHAHAHGCGGGARWGHGRWEGRWDGEGREGRRGGGRRRDAWTNEGFGRAAGEILKRRLRVDDDQEPLVDHALADLRAAVKELGEELNGTRDGLADAFRGEKVDDAAIAAAFARHDDAIGRARREVVSALKQIHAVLDDEQRAKAADWLASGDARWV